MSVASTFSGRHKGSALPAQAPKRARAELRSRLEESGHGLPFGWHSLGLANDAAGFARMYARLGLHPIAINGIRADGSCTCGRPDCSATGKHPVSAGWQRSPLHIDGLEQMLLANRRLNIGLRTGVQPGGFTLICIDIDGPLELLEPLVAKAGPLPETLAASSGKGTHLFFQLRGEHRAPKNKVRLSTGVDIRSEGGQVVVAPSLHRTGCQYKWVNAREPAVLP